MPAAPTPQEIAERVLFDGSVLEELDEEAARAAIRTSGAHGVTSIAVCFLFSFRNPTHEQRVGEIFAEKHRSVNVSLSSDVAPQIREYYRLSTTRGQRVPQPASSTAYIAALDERLNELGLRAATSATSCARNGGVATFEAAAQRSVQTILSGPAAGVVAAEQLDRRAAPASRTS